MFDPAGQRVLVTDKGIDQVVVYRLDTSAGKLIPNHPRSGRVHPGAAPRHLAFGSTGRFAYVNGEADMTLSVFSYDATTGAMQELQTVSTLPNDAEIHAGAGPVRNFSTAEIAVEPSGRFVYVSNRGHDSIASYAIDAGTGHVTPLGHVSTMGRTPRNFSIDPSGKRLYAANQDSDTIVEFSLDPSTGALAPTGQTVDVGAPVCVLFS
jgi:6-phosphogluconolactonase